MVKTRFTLFFVLLFVCTSCLFAQTWNIYEAEESYFSILTPEKFDYQRDTLRNGVAFHYYQLEQRSKEDTLGVLINTWYNSDLDFDSLLNNESSSILDSTIHMVCTMNKLEKIYHDHRLLNGLPCSFASVNKPNGKKQKIYAILKNGHTYLIVFTAKSLVKYGRDIDRYLNSFRVSDEI